MLFLVYAFVFMTTGASGTTSNIDLYLAAETLGDPPDDDPLREIVEYDNKVRGEACRVVCETAISYSSGICAGLSAFGAPIVCLVPGITGIGCAVAEGTLWAVASLCTSGSTARTCELCLEGWSFADLYEKEVEINERLLKVGDLFRTIARLKEEVQVWSQDWMRVKDAISVRLRYETYFDDIDYVMQAMSEIEFSATEPGVPTASPALRHFNNTALTPHRHGLLNLINQLHRLLAGGGGLHGGKSVFELNRQFCEESFLRHFEKTLLNLYQAFFFAGKLAGFNEEESEKFRNVLAKRRQVERKKIIDVCNL